MSAIQEKASPVQERRYLTVLFGDLSGSTALSFDLETEVYASMILDLHNLYEACIERYGGTIVQLEGDGVLACFGYPKAGESDARNAVKAALEITEGARLLSKRRPELPELSAHCGVHTGLVVLQSNPRAAVQYSLFGTAVNISAKLSDQANANEVLVSSASLGRDLSHFRLSDVVAMEVKGADQIIDVVRVDGLLDQQRFWRVVPDEGVTPFTGRRDEFQKLAKLLAEVVTGSVRTVAVIGQPGVGKTRLVRQFLSTTIPDDMMAWSARCEDYGNAEPLGPVLQILRQIFSIRRNTPSEDLMDQVTDRLNACGLTPDDHLYNFIGVLRPELLTDQDLHLPDTSDVTRSIVTLISALSAQTPQLITVDDLQWADQVSRQIIDAISRAPISRLMVIATVREAEFQALDEGVFDIIRLEALLDEDAQTLVSALAPGVSTFDRDKIIQSSGRNTLYLEELCLSYQQQSSLLEFGNELSQSVWLEKLVDARVNRLPEADREVLRTASIIGNNVPVQLLQSILGRQVGDDQIETLINQNFLYQGRGLGTLHFKHGITREVIYFTVPRGQRQRLHKATAKQIHEESSTLDFGDNSEQLAYHYKAAEDWAAAAKFSEIAARKAAAVSALDQVQKHYHDALDCVDTIGISAENYAYWLALSRGLAVACVFDPSSEQLERLEKAIEVAATYGDDAAVANARCWAGYVAYALGASAKALKHLEPAGREAAALDNPELITRVDACLGQSYASASRYDQAIGLLDQAIEVKRAFRRPNRPAISIAYSLACKAAVLGDQGSFDDAYACFDEALDGLIGSNHEVGSSVLCWKSAVLLWQGRWSDAYKAASGAVQIAERVRSLYQLDTSQSLQNFAQWRITGEKAALDRLEQANARLDAGEKRLFLSLSFGWLAHIKGTYGDVTGQRRAAAQAVQRYRQMDLLGTAMAYRALAVSAAETENFARAEVYIDRAMVNAQIRQSRHEIAKTNLFRVELLGHLMPEAERDRLIEITRKAFEEMKMDVYLARSMSLRAGEHASAG